MLDLGSIRSLAITGANGFVGRSVIEKISSLKSDKLPKEITLITRRGIDFKIPKSITEITKCIELDLTESWKIDFNITHLISLAADGSNSPYSSEANEAFKEIGKNLVEWSESCKVSPKVFHASSGACYGINSLSPEIKEVNSKSDFIASRIFVEDILKNASASGKFQLSVGRLFTFIGPNLWTKKQYAINQFIRSAISESKIYVKGNPQTVRSFMHQDAMAGWILKSLVSSINATDLQIGSNKAVTIQELAEFIAIETHSDVVYTGEFESGDIYLPDNSATMSRLGLDEGLDWKSSVKEMLNVLRMERNAAGYESNFRG